MKKYDVVIIGAGTSGLTARREVAKKTDNYIIVDDGPLGTTCARVGCMPSKVLIQVANDFERRHKFSQLGIRGGENLSLDTKAVMEHVRSLRDRFTGGVKRSLNEWDDKLVRKRASFVDRNTLDLGDEQVLAEKIVIATGSRPITPKPWQEYNEFIVDTNEFFELEELPKKMAVIGLGVIGIELGQALYRLGVDVVGITKGKAIGGLSDPELQSYVAKKFSEEMPIFFNGGDFIGVSNSGKLKIKADDQIVEVDKVLVAVGRKPNIDKLGIENIDIALNDHGLPEFNINTMKLKQAPHILIAGDVNGDRPILHEAADEGVIAGHNAVNEEQCFQRRTSLAITFSEPNIATVGKRFQQIQKEGICFVTGKVSFEGQGRSIVKLKEQGLLHVYAKKEGGEILGAELHGPDGEHIAHLLSWAISLKLTVFEGLKLPFYHPVVEEGLRTALRDAAQQIDENRSNELIRCEDSPIR